MEYAVLTKILKDHKEWLNSSGNEGKRADLQEADLQEASLQEADLQEANLQEANLRGVNLRGANLCGADLCGANLCRANLRGATLCGATLWGANLLGANLQEADLRGADLRGANLWRADLRGAINIPASIAANLSVCPEEGSFIGWKKCKKYIIKLKILNDAKRSSATTRKCRCSKAEVLDIQTLDGGHDGTTACGNFSYCNMTIYKIGEIVYPDSFDEDRWNECSHGIHFFITRQEAVDYGG